MKKILALILAFSLLAILTSCSANNTASRVENENPIVVLPDQETRKNINGYKDISSSSETHSSDVSIDVDSFLNTQQSNIASSLSATSSANAVSDEKTTSYVGSKNTKKFHYSTCRYVKKIKESNAITFETSLEAIESGYVPCSVCNP